MAYNEQIWFKAKGYREAGLSFSEISKKTGISKGKISERAKKEQWEQGKNLDYIEAQELIAKKKEQKREQGTLQSKISLECADEVARDLIITKGYITNNSQKIAKKINKMIDEVTDAKSIKDLADANDKISLTEGVNQRHANVIHNPQEEHKRKTVFINSTDVHNVDSHINNVIYGIK